MPFSRLARAGLWCAMSLWALTLFDADVAQAEPFVPKRDARVLERLPYTPGDLSIQALRAQRVTLARDPNNIALAIEAARQYIGKGRAEGDPRYFGYAQAALEPWWRADNAPVEILVLRADLKQASHNFDGALNDLNKALQKDPENINSALTRAIILQVLGRYEDAQRDCATLLDAARYARDLQLTALTCAASVASFNGRATRSFAVLERVVRTAAGAAQERQWALTTLADIATRLGREAAAERYFRAALALGENAWLLGAYADLLLDRGRAREVIDLLENDTSVDNLLLLLALAEQDVGAPTLDKHVAMLRARFRANRLRNDQRHLREEARFALRLLKDPQKALQLAKVNWRVQREPEDARILLRAALAAGRGRAAEPVIEFLRRSGLQDVRLNGLRRQLRTPVVS
ncbi:MAG: tetratricopeptide repeat protein [Gammaproteobacteria bacterium]